MITPAKGDVLVRAAERRGPPRRRRLGPARATTAAGEQCKGYARARRSCGCRAACEISWQDDNTLKLDIDTGMQTRLFHFKQREAQGARSWQGLVGRVVAALGHDRAVLSGPTSLGQIKRAGSLKVDTTNLRAGYLRKNGVPFSENAFMTEYYNLIVEHGRQPVPRDPDCTSLIRVI